MPARSYLQQRVRILCGVRIADVVLSATMRRAAAADAWQRLQFKLARHPVGCFSHLLRPVWTPRTTCSHMQLVRPYLQRHQSSTNAGVTPFIVAALLRAAQHGLVATAAAFRQSYSGISATPHDPFLDGHGGRDHPERSVRIDSYKRAKGRSHTVEKRKAIHPQKPHATSQPSRFSHTPRLSTDAAHNQHR